MSTTLDPTRHRDRSVLRRGCRAGRRRVVPLVNVAAAFLVSGLVVLIIGENPLRAAQLLFHGAFGYGEGIGFTLFYATNFIFTGLAVAVAFHAGLFNIGGEGQAYIGGLGVALVCLALDLCCRGGSYCRSRSSVRRSLRRGLGLHPGLSAGASAAATSSSPPSCSISSPRR